MSLDETLKNEIKAEMSDLAFKYIGYDKHRRVYVFKDLKRKREYIEISIPRAGCMSYEAVRR